MDAGGLKGCREAGGKVDMLIFGPGCRAAETKNLTVTLYNDTGIQQFVPVGEVDNNITLFSLREPVTMNPGSWRNRQLDIDLVVLEPHPVVTRRSTLLFMRKGGTVPGVRILV